MIKLMVVNFSDSRGGAAIAVRQLVCGLKTMNELKVRFVVAEKNLDDDLSEGPNQWQSRFHFVKRLLSHLLCKLQWSSNNVKHSLNIFSSDHVLEKIRESCDIVHFHWINNETLSVPQLGRFLRDNGDKKVVLTLHDEWLFCGAEHCSSEGSIRYSEGYLPDNAENKGVDLDRYVFLQKQRLIPYLKKRRVIITAPSRYLVEMAQSSLLLSNTDVRLVPNIIDTGTFCKSDKQSCRKHFATSQDRFVLLFGAIGGASSLKGADLLKDTLAILGELVSRDKVQLVTFGGTEPGAYNVGGFNAFELGHISGRGEMAKVYSSADLTVVPSRRESFGQVAAESLACETPVIAFSNSGVADIVQSGHSGYLAKAFDTDMMARLIVEFIELSSAERKNMGKFGREHIQNTFSEQVVLKQWLDLYR